MGQTIQPPPTLLVFVIIAAKQVNIHIQLLLQHQIIDDDQIARCGTTANSHGCKKSEK